ncbi:MAG: ABC transporter permease [Synergistaceae bacterium]|jgi:putative ABC transport system permease protein|nr:ABC transporter permease [Synergistaceae bacterium]
MRLRTTSRISLRHLRSKPLQTFSAISVIALSTALAVMTLLLARGFQQGLTDAVEPFDIVVSAKGSPYQLVLNTVFLRDAPVGNVRWRDYAGVSDDARIELAVPLAFGDSYRGYPIVGTTPKILRMRKAPSAPPWLDVIEGRWFEGEREAVLGARTASESGLAIGGRFMTSHGMTGAGGEHEEPHEVVGILRSVKGPYDRAIFVSIEDIWAAHEDHAMNIDGGRRGVTSILAHPISYSAAYSFAASYQRDARMQTVFPAQTAIRLFSIIGRGEGFLSAMACVAVCFSLLVATLALYWSGAARRRERALLRILGAAGRSLAAIAWLEGTYSALVGAVIGETLGRAGACAAFGFIGGATAIMPHAPFTPMEAAIPASIFIAGSIGGLAVAAFERWEGDELPLER